MQIECKLLSQQEALAVMLRKGGCEDMLDSPPEAAVEAVELCKRLPLTVSITGGMILELAGKWQTALVSLLREEGIWQEEGETHGADMRSVEEQVVSASLRCIEESQRVGVETLFAVYAVFPEDVTVPTSVIDALAPLILARAANRSVDYSASIKERESLKIRRWLRQLIRSSLLQGTIEHGVWVHNLVRDTMIARCEASQGGLVAIQRHTMELLLGRGGLRHLTGSFAEAA